MEPGVYLQNEKNLKHRPKNIPHDFNAMEMIDENDETIGEKERQDPC